MRIKIIRVPTSQELLDAAFKQVREQTPRFSKKIRKKERWAKEIEKEKMEAVSHILEERLKGIADSFPQFDSLPVFERELLDASINLEETKKQVGYLKKKARLVQRLRSQTIQQVFASKSIARIRKLSQSFYGRTASVIKKLDKELKALEQKRKQLLEFPRIRSDAFTVILAGFPNVGKTTLLKKLTNSEPRIAPFPFTTKGLKIGYFEYKYFPIQVIDTPGLLDRPLEKRNPIEKKAMAALQHLGETILFLVDPSLSSGFSLEQQYNLWKETQQRFSHKKIIVVITKTDLCSEEQLQEAKKAFPKAIDSQETEELKQLLSQEAGKWIEKQKPA
jgi:nucleolar GTP-binding protein